MLFSSTIFLFAFLPVVLTIYFMLRSTALRNILLLAASLFFYTWGEQVYTAILILSIGLNYGFGLWIDSFGARPERWKVLTGAVASNLALLFVFKYANFLVDNLNAISAVFGIAPIPLAPIHLPIGISFFTFQALTYVVDVYRGDAPAQRSPLKVALYISLFPQLIAGPIVRYRQVAAQLSERRSDPDDIASGVGRFVVGLGKKVILANTLAVPADRIFAIPAAELQPAVAWLGVICFTLQIYYDFSGYSDMAIGLGRCFGFRFPENFDWPYLSRSLREFWQRWHMSLSTFFRDYLYIPLGGNRAGATRTYVNLVAVFLLCGLWHGASWNFVVWGLIHGAFLALERGALGRALARAPESLRSGYVLFIVIVAWVFFRASDLPHALAFLAAMGGAGYAVPGTHPLALYIDPQLLTILAISTVAAAAPIRALQQRLSMPVLEQRPLFLDCIRFASLAATFVLCAMSLAAGTHNPFIYFRF